MSSSWTFVNTVRVWLLLRPVHTCPVCQAVGRTRWNKLRMPAPTRTDRAQAECTRSNSPGRISPLSTESRDRIQFWSFRYHFLSERERELQIDLLFLISLKIFTKSGSSYLISHSIIWVSISRKEKKKYLHSSTATESRYPWHRHAYVIKIWVITSERKYFEKVSASRFHSNKTRKGLQGLSKWLIG